VNKPFNTCGKRRYANNANNPTCVFLKKEVERRYTNIASPKYARVKKTYNAVCA